jgi:hypothetical protein
MNALRIRKYLDSHILPELTPMIGKHVEIIVLEEPEMAAPHLGPKAGSAKDMVTIAADFDSPLEGFSENIM